MLCYITHVMLGYKTDLLCFMLYNTCYVMLRLGLYNTCYLMLYNMICYVIQQMICYVRVI